MKAFVSIFVLCIFLTTSVFVLAQDKQQSKKDVKVEKVTTKDDCCSKEKSSDKTKDKESCKTDKSKAEVKSCCSEETKAEKEEGCCSTEKSDSKSKENKQ